MGTLGSLLLYAAIACGLLAAFTGVQAERTSNAALVRATERAMYAMAALVSAAVLILQYLLITLNFGYEYVAEYTSSTLNVLYRIGSMWAGQGGSLLLWGWFIAAGAAWIVYVNRRYALEVSSYTYAIFGITGGLFVVLSALFASPFKASTGDVAEGMGLNPLLQDPLQIIHPLALYGGYVVYTVPFAIVLGSIMAGRVTGPWLGLARTWGIISWTMLTAGIVLGARWAYAELGWGGYWAWDPVENASLIPWLSGTALLHARLVHKSVRRLRTSSVVLLAATFNLCLFGTFLTRSGVIQSVHAFGTSSIGPILGGAIIAFVIATGAVIVWRLPYLHFADPDRKEHGWFGQLVLAVLLVAMTVAVLWGTIYPLFARAFTGQEIAVTPGFFRAVVAPMGAGLLVLLAVSPFLPGRTLANRTREVVVRTTIFVAVTGGSLLLSNFKHIGVAVVLGFSALSLLTVIQRMIPRVAEGWRSQESPIWTALQNGAPYIGHVGLVVMMAAITLNVAYETKAQGQVSLGKTVTIGTQVIKLEDVAVKEYPDRASFQATVAVLDDKGKTTGRVISKLEQFSNAENLQAQVGILATPLHDVYVVVDEADATPGSEKATLTVYDNPGVIWIWFGGALLFLGGLLYALQGYARDRKQLAGAKSVVSAGGSDVNALLDAALAAAGGAAVADESQEAVTKLLNTARRLSGGDAASDADVIAFLERAKSASSGRTASGASNKTIGIGIGVAVALVAAAYFAGQSSGSALPGIDPNKVSAAPSASASPGVDMAQVADLMKKIADDPKDTESLWSLGNIYFQASDFKNAAKFYTMLTDVKPKDDGAWIAVGAAAFNDGDNKAAFDAWTKAATLNPKNAEAHYNLGFWYLSQDPSDEVKAKAEWQQVIDIDPNSDFAKNVQQHIDSLAKASPSPTK